MTRPALLVLVLAAGAAFAHGEPAALALVGGTVVDVSDLGRSPRDLPDTVVLVRGDRIAAVGRRGEVAVPRDARVIDVAGSWVVPGLVDGFAGMNSQAQANAYLYMGVTSIVGVGGTRRGALLTAARPGPHVYPLKTVGVRLDATGNLALLSREESLRELDELRRDGVKVLLLLYPLPPERTAEIARAARERGLATIGELGATSYAEAARVGVQAFVHTSRYSLPLAREGMRAAVAAAPFGPPKLEFYRFLVGLDPDAPGVAEHAGLLGRSRVGLIPTLSLEYLDLPGHRNPWKEPVAAILDPEGIHLPADPATGERPVPPEAGADAFPEGLAATLLALEARYARAGARHLAGSGTSAFGTMPGISLHTELELLVRIGLTPRQALAAATANFEAVFGWTGVGQVKPGYRADLVVVGKSPVADVAHLREIEHVVLSGERIDRERLLARRGSSLARPTARPRPSPRRRRRGRGRPGDGRSGLVGAEGGPPRRPAGGGGPRVVVDNGCLRLTEVPTRLDAGCPPASLHRGSTP